MKALTTIDDNLVRAMIADPRFTAAIPCLLTAARAFSSAAGPDPRTCRPCRRKQRVATNGDNILLQAKHCIKGLDQPRMRQLKQLLQTVRIRVSLPNAKGQRVKYTI